MTGLLYFIVIAMWASVIIPIGLKNYDRKNLEESLFSNEQQSFRWHWQARESLSSRQRAFARRRRVAMFLLAILVGTIVMSMSGKISFAWVLIPVSLIIAFGNAASKISSTTKTDQSIDRSPKIMNEKISVNSKVSIDNATKEKTEVKKRTWLPVETPLPSYVTAQQATTYARKIESDRPWTGQEMIDAAIKLRVERAQKLQQAQARLEEARALAMENARRAAIAANQNNGIPATPFRRASNQ